MLGLRISFLTHRQDPEFSELSDLDAGSHDCGNPAYLDYVLLFGIWRVERSSGYPNLERNRRA